jgi:uronate dehydrogenase/NAD+ dependent glucose-6-phosphate dehydrogenase
MTEQEGTMTARKRVLVVGMSGLIGGLVGPKLAERHEVRALNRRPVEGYETCQADIADLDAIRPAFEGVDTVVNLTTYTSSDRSSAASGEEDVAGYISTNVVGARNVYEAARAADVGRVVFASAGASVYNYITEEPYKSLAEARWDDVPQDFRKLSHLDPYRPNGVYGASKAWGEALGRFYSDVHGMSVICVRVGHVPKPPQDEYQLPPYEASIYCSHRDIVQMFDRCVEAPDDLRFDVLFACSNNRGLFRDIEHSRKVVGFVPQDGIRDWPWKKPVR